MALSVSRTSWRNGMWFPTAALDCQVNWLRKLPLTDAAWHEWTKFMCEGRGTLFLCVRPADSLTQVLNSMTQRVRERNVLEIYMDTLPLVLCFCLEYRQQGEQEILK